MQIGTNKQRVQARPKISFKIAPSANENSSQSLHQSPTANNSKKSIASAMETAITTNSEIGQLPSRLSRPGKRYCSREGWRMREGCEGGTKVHGRWWLKWRQRKVKSCLVLWMHRISQKILRKSYRIYLVLSRSTKRCIRSMSIPKMTSRNKFIPWDASLSKSPMFPLPNLRLI